MPAITPSRGRGRRTINEINMVPFIDVMLVLLIIFMVTAPLISPSMIALPSVGNAQQQPPSQVISITVGKSDTLQVKGLAPGDKATPVPLDGLAAAVLQAQTANNSDIDNPAGDGASRAGTGVGALTGSSAVVISADKSVQYERVVKVMDVLQRAGVQRVGLAVQVVR